MLMVLGARRPALLGLGLGRSLARAFSITLDAAPAAGVSEGAPVQRETSGGVAAFQEAVRARREGQASGADVSRLPHFLRVTNFPEMALRRDVVRFFASANVSLEGEGTAFCCQLDPEILFRVGWLVSLPSVEETQKALDLSGRFFCATRPVVEELDVDAADELLQKTVNFEMVRGLDGCGVLVEFIPENISDDLLPSLMFPYTLQEIRPLPRPPSAKFAASYGEDFKNRRVILKLSSEDEKMAFWREKSRARMGHAVLRVTPLV